MSVDRINLLNLDRPAMEAFFAELGERPFRATQVMKWIYHRGVDDFERMTDLGKGLREQLAVRAEVGLPEVVADQPSADGSRKWALRLADGNTIETVFIPDGQRGTLCVSSQVGCTLACTFCSTARQGFNRNLTAAEIVGQVVVAQRLVGLPEHPGDHVITNVVMMGMGEPLLNLEQVIPAMEVMQEDNAFGISKRRVTLSTAGVVPAIDRLREHSEVSLAVSLHAPDDALRDRLVPLNRKYPIEELLAACRRYLEGKPHRRITFEYTMLADVNDSPEHARRLLKLMRSVPSKVNLIPFNVFPGSPYQGSSRPVIDRFRDILVQSGVTTITRKTRGDDIDAACGQLVGRVQDRTRRSERFAVRGVGA
ncbi:dual-specificity RNA methyltransferase RlmN [Endothiovibrio diazotrophicus]